MIRKLQLKFVAICMALVTLVMATVLCAIYIASQNSLESLSHQVLRQVIQMDTKQSGSRPGIDVTIGEERIPLPYFSVEVWRGTAYVTGGTYSNLEDTEALRTILDECMSQNTVEGTIESYRLRYLRKDNGLYEKIAFVDMSMEQRISRDMLRPYVRTAAAALVLLLGVSILLSRWATKPVEKSWRQQRQFLSDASHELKTPLTVILSNAELLEAADLPDKPARWADNIHSEARQMRSLV